LGKTAAECGIDCSETALPRLLRNPITGIAVCCARTAPDRATDPATPAMKSRRRIASQAGLRQPTSAITRAKQENRIDGMGAEGHFAAQELCLGDVG